MQQSNYPIKTRFPKDEVQTTQNTLVATSLDSPPPILKEDYPNACDAYEMWV